MQANSFHYPQDPRVLYDLLCIYPAISKGIRLHGPSDRPSGSFHLSLRDWWKRSCHSAAYCRIGKNGSVEFRREWEGEEHLLSISISIQIFLRQERLTYKSDSGFVMFCGIAILESCKPSLSEEHLSNPNPNHPNQFTSQTKIAQKAWDAKPNQAGDETWDLFEPLSSCCALKKKEGWSYLGPSRWTCLAQAAERSSEPPSGFSWRQSFTLSGEHPQDKLWLGQVDAHVHIRIQWQWPQNLSRNFCFGIYGCAGKDWCPLSSIVHYLLNESAASYLSLYELHECHIIVNDWLSKALNSQSQSSLLPAP